MMRRVQSWGSIQQRGHVTSKRENEASNFRPSDRPLNEYEQEQKALRKNLERLKAERLAREVAKLKDG
jgi:hypothetical protein